MAPYGPEPETPGARRQIGLAAGVLVLALSVPYMSDGFQQQVALALQGSVLAPFISMQERLTEGRRRAEQIEFLQAELDSLVAISTTRAALAEENRELRDLLGLAERAGPRFTPATVLRPGTPGSESMFWIDVGAADGVVAGAPVVSARGLVGEIREVRERSSVGIDWTHPDFGVSAMLADGGAYGLVENVRGDFREEDRLMLNGTAYHERAAEGSLVVTSGLGVFPRGIPIGRIDATAEVEGSWRKSYWLRPMVDPASVTHVLVEAGPAESDITELWAADSVLAAPAVPPRRPPLPRDTTPTRTPTASPRREPPPPRTEAGTQPPATTPAGTTPTDAQRPAGTPPPVTPIPQPVTPIPQPVTPIPQPVTTPAEPQRADSSSQAPASAAGGGSAPARPDSAAASPAPAASNPPAATPPTTDSVAGAPTDSANPG